MPRHRPGTAFRLRAAAVEDLGVYRTLESSDAVILASLGSLYETTGDLEAAVECYSAGLADQRSYSVDLLCDRARCLVLLGRLDEARQDLDSYFARDGEDPDGEAAAMLAVCRMNDEDYAGAYEMFHRALRDGYATPYLLYSQSVLCAYLSITPLPSMTGKRLSPWPRKTARTAASCTSGWGWPVWFPATTPRPTSICSRPPTCAPTWRI